MGFEHPRARSTSTAFVAALAAIPIAFVACEQVLPEPRPEPPPSRNRDAGSDAAASDDAGTDATGTDAAVKTASAVIGHGALAAAGRAVVRTSTGKLYVLAATCGADPTCPNNTLKVYRGVGTGDVPAGFAEAQSVQPEGGSLGNPAAAVGAGDRIHAVWHERNGRLMHGRFDVARNVWDDIAQVADTGWTGFMQGEGGVCLAAEENGTLHAVFVARDGAGALRLRRASRTGDAPWTAPESFDAADAATDSVRPACGFSPGGELVVAWVRAAREADGGANGDATGSVRVRVRRVVGTWSDEQTLAGGLPLTPYRAPSLVVGKDDIRHVAFVDAAGTARYARGVGNVFSGASGPAMGPLAAGELAVRGSSVVFVGIETSVGVFESALAGGGGANPWAAKAVLADGSFAPTMATRWAQFFQAIPERIDVIHATTTNPSVLVATTSR